MRWQLGRRSDNVEDRRGRGGAGPVVVSGGIGTIILAVIVTLLGGDPRMVFQEGAPSQNSAPSASRSPEEEKLADFVSVVLADTEDTWNGLFRQMGGNYQEPTLVLFSGSVDSACGYAQAAMGPFYCLADRKVYIDLSFYEDLQYRHGAPGDFAQAYVIAHEIGHHVQNLMGISDKVHQMQRQVSKTDANQLSVMLELQADCFAGIWAHHAERQRQILEPGDVEEALNAASSIGDDRLQRQAQGYVVPDSFTHGSSQQRVRWFAKGLETGQIDQCNTFGAKSL
ncbi:MAG TPA: neutral zinc metallopeptidase [Oscillatoriales cyanobacterium M59_W2019_021]|nr:MAG: flagellar biosynthesis protein FlgM [Cyanobacteria bacterium J055]HIK30779.1 neutral zinc metallopeptidase [Oscillatoriales cyanobacterium M4454_W2019_049]HIK51964.1 neutral zinc metallopeptidase [Oscillatoriales cyanobacterium M59_W2019_021]